MQILSVSSIAADSAPKLQWPRVSIGYQSRLVEDFCGVVGDDGEWADEFAFV